MISATVCRRLRLAPAWPRGGPRGGARACVRSRCRPGGPGRVGATPLAAQARPGPHSVVLAVTVAHASAQLHCRSGPILGSGHRPPPPSAEAPFSIPAARVLIAAQARLPKRRSSRLVDVRLSTASFRADSASRYQAHRLQTRTSRCAAHGEPEELKRVRRRVDHRRSLLAPWQRRREPAHTHAT